MPLLQNPSRTLSVVYRVALVAIVASVTGCLGETIKVGPFPVAIAAGDGAIDPADLGDRAGKFGIVEIEVPLCGLPTLEEIRATVRANLSDTIAPIFTLTDLRLDQFVLTANTGTFNGITSVSAFFQAPGSSPGILNSIHLGTATALGNFGQEIVLRPGSHVNLLDLLSDSESGECPTLLLILSGIAPSAPIAWQGDLFADAFGEISIDF